MSILLQQEKAIDQRAADRQAEYVREAEARAVRNSFVQLLLRLFRFK